MLIFAIACFCTAILLPDISNKHVTKCKPLTWLDFSVNLADTEKHLAVTYTVQNVSEALWEQSRETIESKIDESQKMSVLYLFYSLP